MQKFILLLCISFIFALSSKDIPNFNKYYKPYEFQDMDMFQSSSKWSWHRYKQSEHFFVFWEAAFGSNPNSNSVPSNLRVDIDDLLAKAEQFYNTNIVSTQFCTVGQGKSYLDKYKMEIYLLYQTEWLATGSGYDNVIGALWVNPTTCQPVGSTIGHEIGHSFQYQVYCDQIFTGQTGEWDFKTGFRYGYEGSSGGNGFWEQTAQWQSFQDYPSEFFEAWFYDWPNHNHRHFEHEYMRYSSYWFHEYLANKYGRSVIGNIWRNSKYPEDALSTYMRLYHNNNYNSLREELFDYAFKMATYDIDSLRSYSAGKEDFYNVKFIQNGDYLQIPYSKCPGATGFNVIPLNLPTGSTRQVKAAFVGLNPGDKLAPGDSGIWVKEEGNGGTVSTYNSVNKGNVGWRYGFVSLNYDGSRTYSSVYNSPKTTAKFTVPNNAYKLFMVVQGSPNSYIKSAWDDNETTDAQFPYKVKFTNTSLK